MRRREHDREYQFRLELNEAREIQRGLMPRRMPNLNGFSLASAWQPAHDVSGDYLAAIKFNESRAALCVADVAGKGLPAALLMSNMQAALKSLASDTISPSELCEKLNRLMCGNTPLRKFVSCFYGDLDVSVIRDAPPERLPVKTLAKPESRRDDVYAFVLRELEAGRQAYVVYPLVEESAKVDVKAATEMADHLATEVFPAYRVGLLDGSCGGVIELGRPVVVPDLSQYRGRGAESLRRERVTASPDSTRRLGSRRESSAEVAPASGSRVRMLRHPKHSPRIAPRACCAAGRARKE